MAKKYKNIPVEEEIYFQVKAIAEANGFGERGVGAQVGAWVARDLPDCDHEKEAVVIELFPSQDMLNGTLPQRTGWYCPMCRRVYQRIEKPAKVSGQGAGDPYGQPIVSGQQSAVSGGKKRAADGL
jgi:hypothetical protein